MGSLFAAGDSAQTIQKGLSFRFVDLQQLVRHYSQVSQTSHPTLTLTLT